MAERPTLLGDPGRCVLIKAASAAPRPALPAPGCLGKTAALAAGSGVLTLSVFANPLNRYEVASHTPGLIFRSDGSLSITVSNTEPTDPTTNWLPAPTGDFFLTLRTYIPQEPILNQTWQPPALQLAAD